MVKAVINILRVLRELRIVLKLLPLEQEKLQFIKIK
jgi:hypothetical protein